MTRRRREASICRGWPRAVYAHKRWILLPTSPASRRGRVRSFVKPRYTATAKVLLENGESYFTRPEKAQPDATMY